MNTLPNDHGYGAAEMARGEMSCNDGYALYEMMQPASAALTNPRPDFNVNTINSISQVNL
ncbi:MAG: hypothetical protein ABL985_00205 [Casimicrobium sp.]